MNVTAILTLSSIAMLAAAVEPTGLNWNQVLSNLGSSAGVSGIILGYYLWTLRPLLEGIREEIRQVRIAQERAKRADLLRIAASPHVHPDLKAEVASLITEMDKAEGSIREHTID